MRFAETESVNPNAQFSLSLSPPYLASEVLHSRIALSHREQVYINRIKIQINQFSDSREHGLFFFKCKRDV